MSGVGGLIIELYDRPAYLDGRHACATGKHLIVPKQFEGRDRMAWELGWNEEWTDQNEREPS